MDGRWAEDTLSAIARTQHAAHEHTLLGSITIVLGPKLTIETYVF